ncbi:MAG: (2Fe-2S)-binding protein, partial [Candidatus Heimdallarchaeota archaeon]
HEDKLHRSGVPIYTSHTILSANGEDKVESVTIAKLDDDWQPIPGTERTYKCDTILIAVGLAPVNECFTKAKSFGLSVWVAGDAEEIAEASAAIFTGRIAGVKILETLGIDTGENIAELEEKAQIMKCRPPPPQIIPLPEKEEGIMPIIHCTQEIPCDPCTTVCARDLIKMSGDSIMSLPYFTEEQECTGCGKCVSVCPGLAITLVDYRKDPDFAHVTIPVELGEKEIQKGDIVHVMSNVCEIGDYSVERVRILKDYPKTELVTVKLPKEVAKDATGIQVQKIEDFEEPMEIYHKPPVADEAIVCRCERVTAGEIRKWIRRGVTDMNELKAITRAGMGACGGKTCNLLILRIFREEGIDDITLGTPRPIFVEVPLGIFANVKEMKD